MTSGATPSFGQTARGVSEQQGGASGATGWEPRLLPPDWSGTSSRAGTGHLSEGCVWGGGAFCIVATVSAPNRVVGTELECQSSAAYCISATHSIFTLVGFFLCAREFNTKCLKNSTFDLGFSNGSLWFICKCLTSVLPSTNRKLAHFQSLLEKFS